MKKNSTKLAVYILSLFVVCSRAIAIDVEFYSLSSSISDTSKVQMTEDLFLTQLMTMQQYKVVDKRPLNYTGTTDNPNGDTLVFYGELHEKDNKWICTLWLESPLQDKKVQVSGNYDSYFKILSEAKSSISQLFADMANTSQGLASNKQPSGNGNAVGTPTYDSLSGTWSGESSINKIVLLRGGRGFVIFNNGASMNIEVAIKGNTIVCTQSGKPNASYFPELPREVALVAAMDAQPITWTMTMANNTTMKGTKHSLQAIMESGDTVGAQMGTTEVTWTRQ